MSASGRNCLELRLAPCQTVLALAPVLGTRHGTVDADMN